MKASEVTGSRGLSGSTLKIMAAISMLVDHTFVAVFEQGYISGKLYMPGLFTPDGMLNYNHWICGLGTFMRGVIGRMAFPIFCFLLVQGFTHTSDKRKYKWRLFVFALLSEIPFNLALMDTYRFGTSNVIFTLLLGFVALEAIEADWNLVVRGLAVAGFAALAEVLGTDYGASGVLLITVLYLTRGSMAMTALAGMLSVLVLPSFGQLTATLAFIPILFYNGKRGLNLKYIFYVFYPAHLLALYLARYVMVKG
ncbi:MAG: TraX family protein [Bacillota bacterium]|nr:conjugal transfer protein TraX [Candidatus Fermentithermobacillaceae bacterium]